MRKRFLLGAVFVGVVSTLAFSSLGGAAVGRVSQLIAPTANSAVADVNAFNNWGVNDCSSTCSRAGFKQVTSPSQGTYCLYSPEARPDNSVLLVTVDQEHSNTPETAKIMWDRSSPTCGSSGYEVYTYCATTIPIPEAPVGAPVGRAPSPKAPVGPLCDDVAFYAEAYHR